MSEHRDVYVARHAHREDFAGEAIDPGWGRTAARPYDPGLSDLGTAQAIRLGERLRGAGLARIFCSP